MLGDLRPIVRRVFSPRSELRVKGTIRRVVPKLETESDCFVHASAWKNASQWMRMVLSDPRLFASHDYAPTPRDQARSDGQKPMYLGVPNCPKDLPIDFDRCRVSGLYVFRHPVDQARSWYISTRYSHPENPNVVRMRQRLENLDDEQGFKTYLGYSYESVLEPMRRWADLVGRNGKLHAVDFAELTANPFGLLNVSLTKSGWEVRESSLKRVLNTYDHDKLKPKVIKSDKKYVENSLPENRLPRAFVESTLRSKYAECFEIHESLREVRVRPV